MLDAPPSMPPPQVGGGQPLPGVSIVLPVRGCRSHSLSNWQSVLSLHYGERGASAAEGPLGSTSVHFGPLRDFSWRC